MSRFYGSLCICLQNRWPRRGFGPPIHVSGSTPLLSYRHTQCYHIVYDSRNVYSIKNHNEPYSPRLPGLAQGLWRTNGTALVCSALRDKNETATTRSEDIQYSKMRADRLHNRAKRRTSKCLVGCECVRTDCPREIAFDRRRNNICLIRSEDMNVGRWHAEHTDHSSRLELSADRK